MTRNGMRVLDSDIHVFEPPDLWQRYIAPEFRDRAPVGVGVQQIALDGCDLIGVALQSFS